MPTVTHDTDDARPGVAAAAVRDPAARIRRLLTSGPVALARSEPAHPEPGHPGSAHPEAAPTPTSEETARTPPEQFPPSAALIAAALARFDAPVDVRVRGGLGSGRRTLAAALRARRGWQVTVEDLDDLAAPGAPPSTAPDVEVICLRTAPCRHEEAWVRRPRRHPLLIVATGRGDQNENDDKKNDDHDDDDDNTRSRPHWARGLPPVDARDPEHRSVDTVVMFVERAVDALASVRVARLEAELETLAVHPEIGELAEAALCALDQ